VKYPQTISQFKKELIQGFQKLDIPSFDFMDSTVEQDEVMLLERFKDYQPTLNQILREQNPRHSEI